MSKKISVIFVLLVFCMVFSVFSSCYARPVEGAGSGGFRSSRSLRAGGTGSSGGSGGAEEEENPCKWGCHYDETAGKKVTDYENDYSCYRDNPGVFGTSLY